MALKYKTVIFDFDGTVMNSAPGILSSAVRVIEKAGYPLPTKQKLRKFIGPPLRLSFVDVLGVDEAAAARLVDLYRADYHENDGMHNAAVYEGMEPLLQKLNDEGAACAIASAKREAIVRETAREFGLSKYFKAICGAPSTENVVPKREILEDCIARLGAEKDGAILVGDSDYDAVAARECGVDFCAAMWGFGFGGVDDLREYACRYAADDVAALRRFLLG